MSLLVKLAQEQKYYFFYIQFYRRLSKCFSSLGLVIYWHSLLACITKQQSFLDFFLMHHNYLLCHLNKVNSPIHDEYIIQNSFNHVMNHSCVLICPLNLDPSFRTYLQRQGGAVGRWPGGTYVTTPLRCLHRKVLSFILLIAEIHQMTLHNWGMASSFIHNEQQHARHYHQWNWSALSLYSS